SFPDCLGTRAWVFNWVMPFYGELTAEDERVSVVVAAVEMLKSGTTCFLDVLEACVRELNGAGDGRITCWVNIQGKEPCSAELHVGARDLAQRLGVGTTYHIASTMEERRSVERRFGRTPVARIGALEGL